MQTISKEEAMRRAQQYQASQPAPTTGTSQQPMRTISAQEAQQRQQMATKPSPNMWSMVRSEPQEKSWWDKAKDMAKNVTALPTLVGGSAISAIAATNPKEVAQAAGGLIKSVAQTPIQFGRGIAAEAAGAMGREDVRSKLLKPINVPVLGEVKGISADPRDIEKSQTQTPGETALQAADVWATGGAPGAAKLIEKAAGTKAGSYLLQKASQLAGKITGKLDEAADIVIPLSKDDKLVETAANTMRDILNPGKKAAMLEQKTAVKGARTGQTEEDIYTKLARERVVPELTPDKKLDTTKAVIELRGRADKVDDILSDALKTDEEAWFDFDEVAKRAKEKVMKGRGTGSQKKAMIAEIDKTIAEEKEIAGFAVDQPYLVSGSQGNIFKRDLYGMTNYDPTRSNQSRDAVKEMAAAAKEMIESRYAGKANISEINKILGNYSEMIKALETSHGKVVRGGMLGRRLNQVIGAVAGSYFGPGGAVVGAEIAGKATDFALNPVRKATGASAKMLRSGLKTGEEAATELIPPLPKGNAGTAPLIQIAETLKRQPSGNVSPEILEETKRLSREYVRKNRDVIADEIIRKPGIKKIDSDAIKRMIPGVSDEIMSSHAHAYQDAAAEAADYVFERALKEVPNKVVRFTAGGSGSGKSEVIVKPLEASGTFDGILVDGTMKTYANARAKIQKVLDAGKEVIIDYPLVDPQAAWMFVQKRAARGGHMVPKDVFIKAHAGAMETIKKLAREKLKGVEIHLLDVRGLDKKSAAEASFQGKFLSDPDDIIKLIEEMQEY